MVERTLKLEIRGSRMTTKIPCEQVTSDLSRNAPIDVFTHSHTVERAWTKK